MLDITPIFEKLANDRRRPLHGRSEDFFYIPRENDFLNGSQQEYFSPKMPGFLPTFFYFDADFDRHGEADDHGAGTHGRLNIFFSKWKVYQANACS